MAANIISEFLVALGFRIDEPGLRKFNDQITATTKTVKTFALSFTAAVVAIEEAVRRTTKQFESLFYLAQRTRISASALDDFRFAMSQIGISTGATDSALTSFTQKLTANPALKFFVNQFVPGFQNAEEAMIGLARKYGEFEKMGPGPLAQYIAAVQDLVDPAILKQFHDNLPAYERDLARIAAFRAKLFPGQSKDDAAKQAVDLAREFGFFWKTIELSIQKLSILLFPTIERLITRFTNWLATEGAAKIEAFAKRLEAWFDNPDNIEKLNGYLDTFIDLLKSAADLAVWLAQTIKCVSDEIGPLKTLLLVLFGPAIVGAIAQAGLVAAIGGIGTAAAAATVSVGGLLAILGIVGGAAALYYGVTKALEQGSGKPGTWTDPKSPTRFMDPSMPYGTGTDAPEGTPNIKNPYALPPPNRPHSYTAEPIPAGGVGGYEEATYRGLSHWWAGSGAFRPLVVLAEEVYDKLAEAIRDALGLGPQHPTQPAGQPDDPHGYNFREGGYGGGNRHRLSGGRAGAAGGVSMGQLKQLLIDAGFKEGDEVNEMAATLMHESSGNPNAKGAAGETGIAQVHPAVWGKVLADQSMGNARRSVEIARHIFLETQKQGKSGFSAWSSHNSGAYKQFLEDAKNAKPEPYNPAAGGTGGAYGVPGAVMNYGDTGALGAPGSDRTTIRLKDGRTLTVNKGFAPHAEAFLNELIDAHYPIHRLEGFNDRDKLAGGKSEHAFANAFDLNASPGNVYQESVPFPADIKERAAKHGIIWGGDWKSPNDRPHFQWGGPGAGTAGAGAAGAAAKGAKAGIQAMIGDSIAVGIAETLGVPKDAIGGTTPAEIEKRVASHYQDYAGKTVGVAMGSNQQHGGGGAYDPQQMAAVRRTVQGLQAAGAKVVMMGVGKGVRDAAKVGAELKRIADDLGANYSGPLSDTEGGTVHPQRGGKTDYSGAAEQLRRTEKTSNVHSNSAATVNVYGASNPHGTARAVADALDRHDMMNGRAIRNAIA